MTARVALFSLFFLVLGACTSAGDKRKKHAADFVKQLPAGCTTQTSDMGYTFLFVWCEQGDDPKAAAIKAKGVVEAQCAKLDQVGFKNVQVVGSTAGVTGAWTAQIADGKCPFQENPQGRPPG